MSIPYFCLHGSKINWKHEARRKTNLQQALSQFASMRIWATVFWSLVFHSSITNCGTLRWGLLWCWIIQRIRCFAASRRRSYGVGHDQHYIYACAIVTISYVKAIYFYNSCGVFIILYIYAIQRMFFSQHVIRGGVLPRAQPLRAIFGWSSRWLSWWTRLPVEGIRIRVGTLCDWYVSRSYAKGSI